VSGLIPVYIDDAGGSLYIEAYAFPSGLQILEPGAVSHVPAEQVAAWDAALAAWEAAQREMKQYLDQSRKRMKAEVLAFGRAQDARRIEKREQNRAEMRANAARWLKEAEE
jgi:hypothetical protein